MYSSIGTGRGYGCVLTEDGSPLCFGPSASQSTPPPGPYVELAAAGHWACARTALGAVDCWLTNGTVFTAPTGAVSGLVVTASYACGITQMTGTISCWNSAGAPVAVGAPAEFWQEVEVDSAGSFCGRSSSGTVACWGGNTVQGDPFGMQQFSEIAVFDGTVCGRSTLGGVQCVDFTGDGCNLPPNAGLLHTIGGFGSCTLCGINYANEFSCVGNISGVLPIGPVAQWDALHNYICVLRPDGTVNCYNWGLNGLVISNVSPPATGGCVEGVTADQCSGTFNEGSTCAQINHCAIPTGACCSGDGTCYDDATEEACDAKKGEFSPDQTCEGIDYCRAPLGACCSSAGCFENVTDALCAKLEGVFNQGAACGDEDIACAEPLGACCIEKTGECLNEETQESCAKQEGTFYQDLSCGQCDCSPKGGGSGVPSVNAEHQALAARNDGCATTSGFAPSLLTIACLLAGGMIRRRFFSKSV